MERHHLHLDGGRVLSWLDSGGSGRPLVCLHGHFGQGAIYRFLVPELPPGWRLFAPDQRGHGHSSHTATYTRQDYLADLEILTAHWGLDRFVLLGSSLGGVNAYQFAARHPGRVDALVNEDIGAVCRDDLSWCLEWPRRFANRAELEAAVHPYFAASAVERTDGWDFLFDRAGMVESGRHLNGDWWDDWTATSCPALLMRGGKSTILTRDHAEEMAARRPGTRLLEFPEAGHNINEADPAGYARAVRDFLHSLPA